MTSQFDLPLPPPGNRTLVTGWLLIGLSALIVAGIFSILLVLSRTPHVQDIIPWVDFFHTALVIHVDMSVLIWFLSFAGVIWTYSARKPQTGPSRWLAPGLAAAGMLIIGAAPFFGAGEPLMNNYVPVLRAPLFFAGLVIFASGITLQIITSIMQLPSLPATGSEALRIGAYTALLAALFAIVSLLWSYSSLPQDLPDASYFEYLFWGPGHVVQFTYSQLMLVAWLWLASVLGFNLGISPRLLALIFLLGISPILFSPLIQFQHGSASAEYISGYAQMMKWGGGLGATPIGLLVIWAAFRSVKTDNAQHRPIRAALYSSLLLFIVGGLIGFMTSGINTIIPAHYHGSIVGVTLSFMGLTYYLLPRLGFAAPVGKMATSQPYIYAAGQILHITGLGISGALGIQRKTAGASQGLDSLPEILAMATMGLGGLVAIIGGTLFLVVALRSLLSRNSEKSAD